MKHVTFVHDRRRKQFPECDLEFSKKSNLKAGRLLKTFTVRRLQRLSVILVRSQSLLEVKCQQSLTELGLICTFRS